MNTRRYPQQDGIRRLPQPYGPNDMASSCYFSVPHARPPHSTRPYRASSCASA